MRHGSTQKGSEVEQPGYVALCYTRELQQRASAAWAMLARCELCPHRCGADRLAAERAERLLRSMVNSRRRDTVVTVDNELIERFAPQS